MPSPREDCMTLPHQQASACLNFINASVKDPASRPDSSTADMARLPGASFSFHTATNCGAYKEELWQACAGPLVSVPKVGERVLYFPQGHIEQVAASTGQSPSADQLVPQYNLPSQIPCHVISRDLSAEIESDEVFAQISLLPVSEGGGLSPVEEASGFSPHQAVRIFTKILTASDTSTHGGFSVLRKHAEDCLPPLDMSQENPSQELTATDLHGQEWRFRHTYRGHPRRHLLTTGWSHFVSQKKLVAGDAVVFLRGDNGELRVGIRRTKRQPTSHNANVLTSDCMHMGVIASAAYAIQTRTMFSVYYKPRASPSSFIVPEEKFRASLANKLSIGMRFKMKFEGEDATERSYAGTITCIEDLNAAYWPNSKWRSLMVNWDEFNSQEQCERISPWEIELCMHSQAPSNMSLGPKSKRIRGASNMDIGSSSKSLCSESFLPSMPSELLESCKIQVMQGNGSAAPHMSTGGGMLKGQRYLFGQQKLDLGALAVECHNMAQPKLSPVQGRWLASGNMDPGLSVPTCHLNNVGPHSGLDKVEKHLQLPCSDPLQQLQREGKDMFSFFPESNHNFDAQGGQIDKWSPSPVHTLTKLPSSSHSHFIHTGPNGVISTHPLVALPNSSELEMGIDKSSSSLQHCSLSPFARWDSVRQDKSVVNGCKIFGISFAELPTPSKVPRPSVASENHTDAKEEDALKATLHMHENDQQQKSDSPDKSVSSEPEISDSPHFRGSKDGDSRSMGNPPLLRSCTKVIKKGSMVGRGVDLSKFECYKKLLEELEGMFHIEGELSDPSKGWQVAYSDDEGDMMHVGDDPWMEFCQMVRKIYIFSPEEVQLSGISQTDNFKNQHDAGFGGSGEHRKFTQPVQPD